MRKFALPLALAALVALSGCSALPNLGAPTADTAVVVIPPNVDLQGVMPDVDELPFLPSDVGYSGFALTVSGRGDASITTDEKTCTDGALPYLPASYASYQRLYGPSSMAAYFKVSILEVDSEKDAQDALAVFRSALKACDAINGGLFSSGDDTVGIMIGENGSVMTTVGPYIVQIGFTSLVTQDDILTVFDVIRAKFEAGAPTGVVAAPGSGAPEWAPQCAEGANLTTAAHTANLAVGLCDDYTMLYQDARTGRTDVLPDAGGAGGNICGEAADGLVICSDFELAVWFPDTGESEDIEEFWYGS